MKPAKDSKSIHIPSPLKDVLLEIEKPSQGPDGEDLGGLDSKEILRMKIEAVEIAEETGLITREQKEEIIAWIKGNSSSRA